MNQIGIIVGSLRKSAYSKKVAKQLANLLPVTFNPVFIPIDQLPLYNADADEPNAVPQWEAFRQQLDAVSGLIIVTPEYNRSMSGALKNAFDVGSKRHNHWKKRPALVVSTSPGAAGGFGANQHVRQVLVTLNVTPVQRPEVYLGHVNQLFDANDQITQTETLSYLQTAIDTFVTLHQQLTQATDIDESIHLQFEPGRFFARDDHQEIIAEITCEPHQQNELLIDRTYVAESLRGQGVASQLMQRVIRYAQLYDLKIIPECTYAKAYFKRHRDDQGLLATPLT